MTLSLLLLVDRRISFGINEVSEKVRQSLQTNHVWHHIVAHVKQVTNCRLKKIMPGNIVPQVKSTSCTHHLCSTDVTCCSGTNGGPFMQRCDLKWENMCCAVFWHPDPLMVLSDITAVMTECAVWTVVADNVMRDESCYAQFLPVITVAF